MISRRKKKSRIDRRSKPQAYSSNQLREPIQPSSPRGAYPQPSGAKSVTTGLPQNQDSQTQGMLGGLLMGKGAVDAGKEIYDAGVDANKGFGKLSDWASNKMDGIGETFSGMSMPTMPWESSTLTSAGSVPLPSDFSIVDGDWTSLGNEAVGVNSSFGSPEALSGMADPASGLLADSTGAAAEGVNSGLQATGGMDKLGAAGSALGLGLNIHDMVDGGVNFGNVTGALGSGILGASALGIGAANAWNPVGWGLLAASAGDQLFDWF